MAVIVGCARDHGQAQGSVVGRARAQLEPLRYLVCALATRAGHVGVGLLRAMDQVHRFRHHRGSQGLEGHADTYTRTRVCPRGVHEQLLELCVNLGFTQFSVATLRKLFEALNEPYTPGEKPRTEVALLACISELQESLRDSMLKGSWRCARQVQTQILMRQPRCC